MTDLRTIEGPADGPKVTTAQLVAMDFGACRDVVGMSQEERDKKLTERTGIIHYSARLAWIMLTKDKDELVRWIREEKIDVDVLGNGLQTASEWAQFLREDIRTAIGRL